MKDLTKIINNLDLSKKEDHQLQNKVPPIVKTIVDSLFDQLAFVFPAWKYTWDTEEKIKGAKKEWVKAFFENDINTKEQISLGLKKARCSNTDFLPSCGKFVSWCSPSPEDLGFPSEQKALDQCVAHRNKSKMNMDSHASHFIQTLCKCVDWFKMNTANGQKQVAEANKAFKEEYLHLIANYREPVETSNTRLETSEVTSKRLSPSQLEDGRKRGLEHLKAIRNKLKHKQ